MKKLAILLLTSMILLTACSGKTVEKVEPTQSTEPAESTQPTETSSTEQNSTEQSQDNQKQEEGQAETEENSEDLVARVGEALKYGDFSLGLEGVYLYEDNSNFQLDRAAEGNEFISLVFVAENTGTEDYNINMFLEDSYLDGFSIDPEIMILNSPVSDLWATVAGGKKHRGHLTYQVPIDGSWKELEFSYQPEILGNSSTKMRFIVTPEDVQR